MIKLHEVVLSKKDQDDIKKRFCNGDFIKYKEALGELTIDLMSAVDSEVKWVI